MPKKKIIAAALALGVGLAVAPALGASAADHISGGVVNCSGSVPKVQINSHAYGRINHAASGIVYNSWNNGSTYQYRFTYTGKPTANGWNAYITGVGGNVDYANAVCYGP